MLLEDDEPDFEYLGEEGQSRKEKVKRKRGNYARLRERKGNLKRG